MAHPLTTTEVLSFEQIGIPPQFASLSNTALSGDKYLCVREVTETESNVAIVDLQNGNTVSRNRMVADTAIMHPTKNIIALRGNNVLQVFDLTQRARLKSFTLPEGHVVNYWRWIDADTLAFVSGTNVYRWSLSQNTNPTLLFALQTAITSGAIMSLNVSDDQNWYSIFAIVRDGGQSVGKVQLYSKERSISHVMDAYTSSFATIGNFIAFLYITVTPNGFVFNVNPLGSSPQAQQFGKRYVELPIAQDNHDDIPFHMLYSPKFSTAFILTRNSFLYLIEVETPALYFASKVSNTPFIHSSLTTDGGILALSREGRMTKFSLNANLVEHLSKKVSPAVATKVATMAGFSVSPDMVTNQFFQLLQQGNVIEAANIAANTPALRTPSITQRIIQLPTQSFLQYFSRLLELTKLNDAESFELSKFVLQQNKTNLITTWIKEDKITCTEELGDLCRQYDSVIALAVYLRSNSSPKVVACFAEMGAFDKITAYCQKTSYNPNWLNILSISARSNPDHCDKLLNFLANNGNPIVDPKQVVSILMQLSLVKQASAFLMEVLTQNRESDSELQTLLFEIALTHAPKFAEELFAKDIFTYYDSQKIAGLCERAGNFQRALEHYTDLPSIKRCIVNVSAISQDFLMKYFEGLSPEWGLECFQEILERGNKAGVQIVVTIASQNYEKYGIEKLIALFAKYNEALFYFLAQAVNFSDDPEIHFRYIDAAAKRGNYQEVERMCTESQHLQPERVRDYLMQSDLPDRIPLIVLCNRFGFIEDMTKFLYKKQAVREIETYVTKLYPNNAGKVIGALIDIEAPAEFIVKLINAVQHVAPIDELIRETMKRERLKLLQPLLEQRAQSGSVDAATNNGIVLLSVLSNRNPEKVLQENQYYDPLFVGEVLEKRDAHLAFLAYAHGACDQKVIELTNQHELYKEQARYCVNRQSPELWAAVLSPENEHMQLVVDAVISTALPECNDPDKVSQTVRAFIEARIPNQLIGLLEKVVLESPAFHNNTSLQNLLIITAIKADPTRVMGYVTRLADYTYTKICEQLKEAGLYEEAVAAYRKFGQNVDAVKVLIQMGKLKEAGDLAISCGIPQVFSELGKAQLSQGLVKDAINSLMLAKDGSQYKQVIELAEEQNEYAKLVEYLKLARETTSEVDSELCFALAKTDRLSELEDLLSNVNSAKASQVGERCVQEKLWKAAKILFSSVKDYSRLAEVLIELNELQAAIEAAKKAQSSKSWKAVNRACVENGDFKLAQIAGLHIVVEADQLNDIVSLYEGKGLFNEIISLLEASLTLERTHSGIFTELAVLYAKHQPAKVMDHLTKYHQRIALFKLIKQLDKMHMWKELALAYEKYNEFDNAVLTMVSHPSVAFNHTTFLELIAQVSNADICYRSIDFYITYFPMNLIELMQVIGTKVDITRLVTLLERTDSLRLVKSWLVSIQKANVTALNEAMNRMYIEDGDFEGLRRSIDSYNAFDHFKLARELENHELLEFRRIAAYIYRGQKRWEEAIEISKKDKFFRDAIETASMSREKSIVENLIRYFVDEKLFECFAAATFVCFDLLTTDVVMELAWKADCIDFAMPFMIQSMKEQNAIVGKLEKEVEELKKEVREAKATASESQAAGFVEGSAFPGANEFTTSQGGFVSASGDPFTSHGAGSQNFPPMADPFQQGAFPAFPPANF